MVVKHASGRPDILLLLSEELDQKAAPFHFRHALFPIFGYNISTGSTEARVLIRFSVSVGSD